MSYRNKDKAKRPRRIWISISLVIVLVLCSGGASAWAQNNRSIKVMTQNMDAGTDLGFIFGLSDPVQGAQLTYQELTTQSDIPGRAQRLAAEIAAAKPDLISLQEVTTWAVQSGTETQVVFDQLALLTDALAARKEHYVVVATHELTEAGAPLNYEATQFLLFNDSDVILARADDQHPKLEFSNVQMDLFQNLVTFVGVEEKLGWMSVDVDYQGSRVRFFNTHLQSTNVLFPALAAVQVLQGDDLIQVLDASPYPVILAGDFNSDASGLGIGPDLTDTAGNIESAGYVEVWGALHPPDPGLTWPRYLEDIYPIPASQVLAQPTERIDLIFAKGLSPVHIERTLRANQPLASDHVGVMATLRFDK